MIRVKMTARSWTFEDQHRFCVFFSSEESQGLSCALQ